MRVGLVGAGPWAHRVHGPALAAHPDVELAGVWVRRPEAAAELAGALGCRALPDLDALLATVDAVALAVPPHVQAGIAVRAAAAGRHLVCEKPLALDLPAAREVAAAVATAGVHSAMVLTLRFDPGVREWLDAGPGGVAGPDTVGTARWLSGSLLGGPYAGSGWRADHGALFDLGPHLVDLLDAALGPVTGVAWAHHAEPDLWQVGLRHAGGARSTAVLSLRVPVDPSEVEVALFGRDAPGGRHRFSGRVADATACYARLLDDLVAAVRGAGPPPAFDVARGLRLQELVDEARVLAGR